MTVKETTTIGWIHLPDHSHSPGRATVDGLLGDTCDDDYADILPGGQANSGLSGS